jgi:predicted enzyme related to lactoylglutathione lyase
MNRVVHFEIHAKDLDAAQKFYSGVFGWKITDLGPQMGNYRMVSTGEDEAGARWPGINGGITPRMGNPSSGNEAVNAFVCTISVDNLDSYINKVKTAGGSIALDKMQVPGVGWLVYVKDPENNIFGMLQPESQT